MAFTLVTIRGRYVLNNDTPAKGRVTIQRSAALQDTLTEEIASAVPVTLRLDAAGQFSTQVEATDDTNTVPTSGVTYRITERIGSSRPRSYSIQVLRASAGAGIDLASVAPAVPGPPVTTYALQSALVTETTNRTAADAGLQAQINTLVSGGGAPASNNIPLADSGTGVAGTGIATSRDDHRHPLDAAYATASGLTSEATARANADTSEASARAGADTTLTTNLAAEVTNRTNADSAHVAAGDPHPQYQTQTENDARYPLLTNTGTAASRDVPASGNAGSSEVVKGDDTRLVNSRIPTAHAATHVTGGGDTVADAVAAGNSGLMSGTDKTKLNGIASGATANSPDATLLARANHTGTQAVGTITGLGNLATQNNPMSAAGDMIVGGTGGALASQAKGPDNYAWMMDPATHLPVWRNIFAPSPSPLLVQTEVQLDTGGSITVGNVTLGPNGMEVAGDNTGSPDNIVLYDHLGGVLGRLYVAPSPDRVFLESAVAGRQMRVTSAGQLMLNGDSGIYMAATAGGTIIIGQDTSLPALEVSNQSATAPILALVDHLGATKFQVDDDGTITTPYYGTAATKDVPASGDASSAQVVKGSDTRLTNSRTPTGHHSSHAPGGSDPFIPSDLPVATPTTLGTIYLPSWMQPGSGRRVAAAGIGDPERLADIVVGTATPTQVSNSGAGARCVSFCYPFAFAPAHLYIFGRGALAAAIRLAIFQDPVGGNKIWDSGDITTASNTFVDITTAGTPALNTISFTKDTIYWMCVSSVTVSASPVIEIPVMVSALKYIAGTSPLGDAMAVGVPVHQYIAMASGVFPSTLPTLATPVVSSGYGPMVWFVGTIS